MQKKLSVERTQYLDLIGFVWNFFDCIPWAEMYERLVIYKQHHNQPVDAGATTIYTRSSFLAIGYIGNGEK